MIYEVKKSEIKNQRSLFDILLILNNEHRTKIYDSRSKKNLKSITRRTPDIGQSNNQITNSPK